MKKLFVLRHAKSSWDDFTLTDFERTLNERGLRTAPLMGEFMRKNNIVPDLILSSPAVRARETARLVKEAAKFTAEIKCEPKIYEASVGDLHEVIKTVDDGVKNLLIVGHNPGLEGLVMSLAEDYQAMPTAALAEIDLQIESWSRVSFGGGNLKNLFKPKELF